MNEELSREDLEELEHSLEKVIEASGDSELYNSLVQLLAMPEEHFVILAPGIMQSFQQSLNNPNDKLTLVQTLNASGGKVEDLIESLKPILDAIEEMDMSSVKKDFLKEMFTSIINSMNDTTGIAKRIINVPIELCHPNAKIPQYAHITDSGMDVFALEDVTIGPGETVLVPTGIKIALPPGYELQVRPKSGRALKTKLRIANTPGTIDQGYRDEIGIIVENIDPPIRAIHPRERIMGEYENGMQTVEQLPITAGDIEFGSSYTIGKGEKFAQLVLSEVPKVSFYRVESVQDLGEDRGGGFGSTGLK